MAIQQSVVLEFLAGLVLIFILWGIFVSRNESINICNAFLWCFDPPKALYFSIIFVLSGTFLLLLYTVFTTMIEIFLQNSKGFIFIRSLLFMMNCIPVYILTDYWRYAYGYEGHVLYQIFFYGLAALIFGNAIWLYVHRYFVESLKNELKQNYFETAHALGFSTVWVIWPKLRLLLLDVFRSIVLVLLGCSIFVENRFRYAFADHSSADGTGYLFEGVGYLFSFDLKQMAYQQHDYEMITGIILSVLIFSTIVQFIVNLLQNYYNPEVRFGK
jgi:ABC-type dipeptide/oligopeptide/nickel transport system permease component